MASEMQKAKRLICHKDRNLRLYCEGGSLGSLVRNS